VSPPSSRPELIEPYRAAFQTKFPDARDLSGLLTRDVDVRSGEGTSIQELAEAVSVGSLTDRASLHSLLIIDDVMAAGKSVTVVIRKLRQVGLPEACAVTIACPLWMRLE
jgi:hypothetical protein